MNKWLFLLLLIGLGGAGWVNRDKISAYIGHKDAPAEDAPAPMATPHPAIDSITRAKKMFPALAIANSPFNKRFLELYNDKKAADPNSLTDADWPMKLAQQAATELNTAAPSYQPPTSISSSPLNARPMGSAPGSTVPPTVMLPGLQGSALDQRPPSKHH
ncbi:MAG: hypothetical protein ABJF10_02305 [Chthoniobacter sp.]|uniref:hypothetical protein n=1 Tax=Chthoniobacter sp. TaxID=2510640 RepID=UPI0032A5173B